MDGTYLQPPAKSSRRGRQRKYRFRSTLDVFLLQKRRAQEYLSERPKLIFECLIKIINTYSICTFFCIRFRELLIKWNEFCCSFVSLETPNLRCF